VPDRGTLLTLRCSGPSPPRSVVGRITIGTIRPSGGTSVAIWVHNRPDYCNPPIPHLHDLSGRGSRDADHGASLPHSV
jgi:hypothetical protein